MSWEIANEKWLDGKEDGLLGQFASGGGYSDLIVALDKEAKEYPALTEFVTEGFSEKIPECRAELKTLADSAETDVADTAKALSALMKDQEFVMVSNGQMVNSEAE